MIIADSMINILIKIKIKIKKEYATWPNYIYVWVFIQTGNTNATPWQKKTCNATLNTTAHSVPDGFISWTENMYAAAL